MYSVKEFRVENFRKIHQVVLANSTGEIKYVHRLVLFRNEIQYVVALSRGPGADVQPKEATYFQLYETKDEETANDAFKILYNFFDPLLSHGKADIDESFLRKLITHEGPIQDETKLIEIILDWDNGEALSSLFDKLFKGKEPKIMDNDLRSIHHLAVIGDKYGVLHNLLHPTYEHYAIKNMPVDKAEKIDALLKLHDKHGDTSLILAAKMGNFKLLMVQLLANADPSYPNSLTGKTPLHYAAEGGFTDIVTALIAFGADINVKDKEGRTPIEVARVSKAPGAAECYAALKKVVDAIDKSPSDVEMSDTSCPEGDCILALDGGGVRGLIEALILSEIEKQVKRMCPEVKSIIQCFDVVAGTSTGSFFIAGLVYGDLTLSQMRNMYFKFKDKAFKQNSKPIKSDMINLLIKEAFGGTATLAQETVPKVIVCSTLASHSPPSLYLMCNYGKPRQGQVCPADRKVWEAVRASSAAPTYFEAFEKKFIDGGLMANNPTLVAMTESLDNKDPAKACKLSAVVSIGTGVWPAVKVGSVNIPGFKWTSPIESIYHSLDDLYHLSQVLLSQLTNSDGPEVQQARIWCKSINCEYVRLSPEVDSIDLAETDDRKLTKMMFQTYLYTLERQDTIRQTAMLLAKKFKTKSGNE